MKTHLNSGNGVPACRNNINPRGRRPNTTKDPALVTCEKCKPSADRWTEAKRIAGLPRAEQEQALIQALLLHK